MAKRQPVLTRDELRSAIERARKGKGRQLAAIIKSCPLDDLAKGLSQIGPLYDGFADEGVFLAGLGGALNYCMGMREGRADLAGRMKVWRKERRANRKAEARP